MKKTYLKPEFKVVKLQSRTRLLVGSGQKVSTLSGNAGFNSSVTGGSGNARSRGDWEDEEFAE